MTSGMAGWSKHLRLNLAGRSKALSGDTRPVRVPVKRIEQRTRLRNEQTPVAATLLVRGGPDTADKLRRHAERTARAWALDGHPLLGISVFAVLDMPLDDLLRRRFNSFRTIYVLQRASWRSPASSCCPPDSGRTSRSGSGTPTPLSLTGC